MSEFHLNTFDQHTVIGALQLAIAQYQLDATIAGDAGQTRVAAQFDDQRQRAEGLLNRLEAL